MKKIVLLSVLLLVACPVDEAAPTNNSSENNTIETMAECDGKQIDGDEICDGENLSDNTCVSLGFGEGPLGCKRDCSSFDLSDCGAPETCGNGQLDEGEVCDGGDLAGASCKSLGAGEGAIFCDENCLGRDISVCDIPLRCDPECPGDLICERGVCSGPLSNIIINEAGFDVTGTVQIEGGVPFIGDSAICNEDEDTTLVVVIFTERTLGYRFDVEIGCKDNFAFQAHLPPGTYEVRVRKTGKGRLAEINLFDSDYLVQSALKVDQAISNLILNEVGFEVSGRIQVEGRPPVFGKRSRCNRVDEIAAQLVFTEPILGYRITVDIGCLDNFGFRGRLPVGIYDVRLRARGNGRPAQINLFDLDYLVHQDLNVDENISNLILNEAGFDLSGKIQVEGQQPVYGDPTICEAADNYKVADITFIEPTLGYRIELPIECSHDFQFQTRLPIGTYEVRLRKGRGGRPQINLFDVDYLVLKHLKINKNISNLFLNEVGFDVAGKIQVEGQPPVYGDTSICVDFEDAKIAEVIFTETTLGYQSTVEIKCEDNFAFQVRLPVGTYDVRLRVGRDARRTQINLFYVDYLVQKDLKIDKDLPSLFLNELGFDISGKIQVEGEQPVYGDPTVCQEYENAKVAVVDFIEPTLGYQTTVGIACKDNFAFQTRLPVGTYEVRLKRGSNGPRALINLLDLDYLIQKDLKIDENISNMVLNEVGFDVSGKIQVEGKPPVYGEPEFCENPDNANKFVARLEISELKQGYRTLIPIKCQDDFKFETRLPRGVYEMRLSGQNVGSTQINLFDINYLGISQLAID